MSDKAQRMLKHMHRQLWMQTTRDASVWRAALSLGVKPEEGEFDALLTIFVGLSTIVDKPTLHVPGSNR